jgi:hypothetical protein
VYIVPLRCGIGLAAGGLISIKEQARYTGLFILFL